MLLLTGVSQALTLTSPRATDTWGLFRDPVDYADAPAGLVGMATHEIHTQLSGEPGYGRFGAGYVGGSRACLLTFVDGYLAGFEYTEKESEGESQDTTTTTTSLGGTDPTATSVTTTTGLHGRGMDAVVGVGVPAGAGGWGVSATITLETENGTVDPDPDGYIDIGGATTSSDPEGIDTTGEYRDHDRRLALWGGFRSAGQESGHAIHLGVREDRAVAHVEGTWTDGTTNYSVTGFRSTSPYSNHQQWGPALRWEGWFGLPGETRLRVDVEGGLWAGGFAETRFDERWALGEDGSNSVVTLAADSLLDWDVAALAALDAPIGTARVRLGVAGGLGASHARWQETTEGDSHSDTESHDDTDQSWSLALPAALEVPIGPRWTIRAGARGSLSSSRSTDERETETDTRSDVRARLSTSAEARLGVRFAPAPALAVDVSGGVWEGTSTQGGDTGEEDITASGSSSLGLSTLALQVVARF